VSADPELERQVERGSLFTHSALGRSANHLREVETYLYGLVDLLLAKRLVTSEEVGAAVDRVERTLREEIPEPGVALRVDERAPEPSDVIVDCAARMHICHAACCKLNFALSAEEVERGTARWDLGRPTSSATPRTGTACTTTARRAPAASTTTAPARAGSTPARRTAGSGATSSAWSSTRPGCPPT
jgi:hypothetical protein